MGTIKPSTYIAIAGIVLVGSFSAMGQDDEKIIFQDVIEVGNTDQVQLYDNGKSWADDTYNSDGAYVENSDNDQARIKCKGSFKTRIFLFDMRIRHSLYLDFKDDRCRYTFTDFIYESNSGGGNVIERALLNVSKTRLMKATEKAVEERVESLEKSLK